MRIGVTFSGKTGAGEPVEREEYAAGPHGAHRLPQVYALSPRYATPSKLAAPHRYAGVALPPTGSAALR